MLRRRVRAWWDYSNYVYGSEWKYLIGLLGIVLGLVVSVLDPVWAVIISIAGTVLTVVLLLIDTDDLRQRWLQQRVTRNPEEINTYPFRTAEAEGDASPLVVAGGRFIRFSFRSGHPRDDAQPAERNERIWLSDEVNRALQFGAGCARAIAEAGDYRLPPDLKQIAPVALWKSSSEPAKRRERVSRPLWFNGRLARLALEPTVERIERGEPLSFQRVTYFDGEASNEIWHWSAQESLRDSGRRLPLAYVVDVHHRMFSLERSQTANIVGVSLLAVTSDDRVMFVQQSQRNSVAPGAFAASASGSLDWADVTGCTGRVPLRERWRASVRREGAWRSDAATAPSLAEVLGRGMLRELREESLVRPHEIDHDSFRVTGYFRWLARAAKPEFCGIVRVNVTAAELHERAVSGAEALFTHSTVSIPAEELRAQARERDRDPSADPGWHIAEARLSALLAESRGIDPAEVRLSTSTFTTWLCAVEALRRGLAAGEPWLAPRR